MICRETPRCSSRTSLRTSCRWSSPAIAFGPIAIIGILSAGRGDFGEGHPDLVADPAATNEKLHLLFLGCGTLDGLAAEGMERTHRLLMEKGIEHVYWTLEGAAHTWVVWRSALYHAFLPRLWQDDPLRLDD
jgi:hypothetical protein